MKAHLFLFLALLPNLLWGTSHSRKETMAKLAQINVEWNKQPEAASLNQTIISKHKWQTENAVIQSHLLLVYQILNGRQTHHLTPLQLTNRHKNLASLLQYAQSGRFPINNKIAKRNPVFIDDYETFCAVGYLIKASGYEWISREIQQHENLLYVRQIQNPNLKNWAAHCGLSVDELAWIQPSYIYSNHTKGVGKGVNGQINAMEADTQNRLLYIGGAFSLCDSAIASSNLAYIDVSGANAFYKGFDMVFNGEIFALKQHQQQLYVGGGFVCDNNTKHKNIMRWNGSEWFPMAGIEGRVLDIEVFQDTLYAAGKFNFMHEDKEYQNMAKWDGQRWLPVVETDTGTIYDMEVYQNNLFVAGALKKVNSQTIGHIFSWDGSAVDDLDGGVKATVLTLYASDQTKLMAGGVYINGSDTFGLGVYDSGRWSFPIKNYYAQIDLLAQGMPVLFDYHPRLKYVSSIIHFENQIILGGDVQGRTGIYGSNYSAVLGPLPTSLDYGDVLFKAYSSFNGQINCLKMVNHKLYFGGNHSLVIDGTGSGGSVSFHSAGMGLVKGSIYNGVTETDVNSLSEVSVFPVPSNNKTFHITCPGSIKKIEIIPADGRKGNNQYQIDHMDASIEVEYAGMYFLKIELADGEVTVKKVISN